MTATHVGAQRDDAEQVKLRSGSVGRTFPKDQRTNEEQPQLQEEPQDRGQQFLRRGADATPTCLRRLELATAGMPETHPHQFGAAPPNERRMLIAGFWKGLDSHRAFVSYLPACLHHTRPAAPPP